MDENNQDEHCVLVVPGTRRDGEVISQLLAHSGMTYVLCADARSLAERLRKPVGVMLLTDAIFKDSDLQELLAVVQRQEPWSDLPSVLLCKEGHQSLIAEQVTRSLHNVTVLDRPTPTRTLLSSLKAALRARDRQYALREQYAALESSKAALKKVSDDLQDANRRKDEFLAMLAHELRNPLAPIQTATEVMARRFPDAQSQAILSVLKRQSGQLSRLVDDLLDVSRINEGRISLREAPVEVAAVLAQAVESVEPLIRDKHHSLSVTSGAAEPLFVRGDYARLVQSVANLLTNAAKYTDPGGDIAVQTSRQGDSVVIAVSDNGVGIGPELLPRVFDLFVQGTRSLDRSQGGLGIGLSVVKRLVEMHGGQIRVESNGPRSGSTFTITLPLIEPAAGPVAAPAFEVSSKHILVVDDNQDAADSLKEILTFDGHMVDVVYTGRDAIARAMTMNPDVVLLDVGLPDMSGYEVAAQLRPMLPETQLIALTGYGQPDDIRRTKAAGFDAHVIKPVDSGALARLMQEFSRGPAASAKVLADSR